MRSITDALERLLASSNTPVRVQKIPLYIVLTRRLFVDGYIITRSVGSACNKRVKACNYLFFNV